MEITKGEARYLKTIYRKQYEENTKVKTTGIAKSLGVRPGTVTEALQNLQEKGFLNHKPYYGVDLTDEGVSKARELLRKHRILETLFVTSLDYDPDRACEEALQLDYHASEELIDSICQLFEHPEVCPCGKKIFRGPKCEEDNKGGAE